MRRLTIAVAALTLGLLGSVGWAAEQPPHPSTPDGSLCRVSGRTPKQLQRLRAFVESRGPLSSSQPAARALPQGSPADSATQAAIADVVETFFACIAAGEPNRAYLLASDAYLVRYIDNPHEALAYVAGLAASTPVANPPREQALYAGPWNVQMMPDGSAAAAVWFDSEDEHPARGVSAIWLFVFEDGHWRLNGTITSIYPVATPVKKRQKGLASAVNVADLVGWPDVSTPTN